MPTGKHRRPSTTDLPSSNVHPALVTRVCRDRAAPGDLEDRVGLEVRDRAVLEGLGREVRDRAGLEDLVGPDREDPEDLAGLEDTNPAALGVLEDMNRVAPGVMEDLGPADLGDLVDLASLGVLEDMDLADLAALEDLGLAVPNLAGRAALADRVGLGLRALDPEGREARDLSLGRVLRGRTLTALDRVLLDRMPADLDRMPADLDRMPADLDRTRPADRLWEPTTRVEPTRPEARMRLAETTLAEATRRAGATHLAEVTDSSGGADASGELMVKAIALLTAPHMRNREADSAWGMATNHHL